MFGYLSKALSQLGDPVLRRVLLIGVAGSAVVFILLNVLVWWIFSTTVDLSSLSLWGWLEDVLDWIAGFVVGLSLLIVSAVLFPGVSTSSGFSWKMSAPPWTPGTTRMSHRHARSRSPKWSRPPPDSR